MFLYVFEVLYCYGYCLVFMLVDVDGWDMWYLIEMLFSIWLYMVYFIFDFYNLIGVMFGDQDWVCVMVMVCNVGIYFIVDEMMMEFDIDCGWVFVFMVVSGLNVIMVGLMLKIVWGGMCIGWICVEWFFIV